MNQVSHRNGTKNNWRRWQANRVIERLTVPASDAQIVYLPGIENLDMPVLTGHGMRPLNMLACDVDPLAVAKAKADGVLAVEGRIENVIVARQDDWPMHAILLDLQWGVDRACNLWWALLGCVAARDSVIALNVMRGAPGGDRGGRFKYADGSQMKHRGLVALHFLWCIAREADLAGRELGVAPIAQRAVEIAMNGAAITSYQKPSGLRFDSVVFRWPRVLARQDGVPNPWLANPAVQKMRQSLIAMRAVRTRRLAA